MPSDSLGEMMKFRCLLVIFIAAPFVLDSWALAQENSNSASQILLFDPEQKSKTDFEVNEAFDIGSTISDDSFVSTTSYAEKKVDESDLDAKYARAQQSVINDSLRLVGMALAVIVALVVGATWLYNNSTDEYGERRRDRSRR